VKVKVDYKNVMSSVLMFITRNSASKIVILNAKCNSIKLKKVFITIKVLINVYENG
jgi:hypothetical protein